MSEEAAPSVETSTEAPSPFLNVWIHPRRTLRSVLETAPKEHVAWILLLTSAASSLDNAFYQGEGDSISSGLIVLRALTIGSWLGLLGYWIFAHIISWCGEWFGGRGDTVQIRAALAWGSLPKACSLIFWGILVWAAGSGIFGSQIADLESEDLGLGQALGGLLAIAFIPTLQIWSLVLLCHTIAEAQGFKSAWRGLLNLVVAFLCIMVPLVILFSLWLFLMRDAKV